MDTTARTEKVEQVQGGAKLLLSGLGNILKIWQSSLRFVDEAKFAQVVNHPNQGTLFLFWHNRIFPVMAAYRRVAEPGRELHALVSASKDGAQFSHFVESCGIKTVRGSSSRRGGVAARELLRILQQGHHVAISVDGPRGPCYQTQPGAALLLQATGIRPTLLGAESENCRTLSSWDRFIVPWPGSRIRIKMDRSTPPDAMRGKAGRQAVQLWIQDKLNALTGDTHREV
jgi:hypothetical protein